MKSTLSLFLVLLAAGCATPMKGHSNFITVEQLVAEDPAQINGDEVHVFGWVCIDGPSVDLRIKPRCDEDEHGLVLNVPKELRSKDMKIGPAYIVGTFVDNSSGDMLLNYKRNRYLGNFAIDVASIRFHK